jgi:chromosome segregation protein
VKLQKIKAFGFKTFAEPTTLEFGEGITAIVGPNGSGKSNLVDAFRWVLGETSSRSLRGGKLEDVIFAGNDRRKPLGLAEVSVTFDNGQRTLPIDYSEVEITRRAYRAGESEYYINRTPVRLRDVHDLLMGTGLGPGSYAIVSQGQVDAILTSKPPERRALFEETAGINKFLARKNESLRRLERTEQNAIRLSDVIAEIEQRIPELETQVRRAKRYRKLSDRTRDLEILGYVRAGASRRAEREAVRARLEANEAARAAAAAASAAVAARLSETRTAAYRQDLQLEELRAQSQRKRAELAGLEADYAAALARREALERQNTQTSENAARTEEERQSLTAALADLQARLRPHEERLEEARDAQGRAQEAVATARARLDAVFTELRDAESTAARSAADDAARRVQAQHLLTSAEQLEAELESQRERAAALEIAAGAAQRHLAELHEQAERLEAAALEARGRAEDSEVDVAQAQHDLAGALSAHRDAGAAVAAAESRLHTIEELENAMEGHVPGTRAVVEAWQRGELAGVEGVVSNLIATDERYARAMDIAFGARLSNVVTKTSGDAERAIDYLNRTESGRATFLPLDTLGRREGRRPSPELKAVPGVIAYAHELVRTQPEYSDVVHFLVGSVLIVDTLATGIALVRGHGLRDTIVTLAGEQISGGGAITGGRFKRERSILSRRAQARGLRETLVGLRAAFEAGAQTLRRAEERAKAASQARDHKRDASAAADVELAHVRAQTTAAIAELERAKGALAAARERVAELSSGAQTARRQERELHPSPAEAGIDERRRNDLETELAAARSGVAAAEADHARVAAQAAELRESLAELSAEREAAGARLGMLDRDEERARLAREEMLAQIATLLAQTRTSHARIEGLRGGIGDLDASLDAARRERERLSDEQMRLESDVRSAEIAERDAAAEGERERTRLAEIEAELGMLVSQFAQHPATDEECRDVEARYAGAGDEVVGELPRLRDELARLSANVNLNAETERAELGERDAFLRSQLEDLTKARETLLESIREIEQQTQVQFNETFERVARAFEEMFPQLFPGGRAKMWQTDPDNLSETGIEIAVQPPGKKQMPLAALSGGERAMTAAALIFALVAVKPSPFYLLDEVDAALDDANVERFSETVKRFAAGSQMIVVTHNKRSMEMAHRLYGVTMSEPGVSSIVSAELTAPESEPALV